MSDPKLARDEGSGGLNELPAVQDSLQKQSKLQSMLSNVLKKISDIQGSLITKGGGLAGVAGGQGAKTGPAVTVMLVALMLVGGGYALINFLIPTPGPPDLPAVQMPEPGPPDLPAVQIPEPGPPEMPQGLPAVQYPPNPCSLAFVHPPDPGMIPLQGALNLEWSSLPGAVSYEFKVIPPDGGGNPWVIRTGGTSKSIFMENFPAAGQYKFAVTAMDPKGTALCGTEMVFEKAAGDDRARQAQDYQGQEPGGCYSMVACP